LAGDFVIREPAWDQLAANDANERDDTAALPCVDCGEPTDNRKGERDDVPCCEDCHYCGDDPCDAHNPYSGTRPW
jgi:hypothetical protein